MENLWNYSDIHLLSLLQEKTQTNFRQLLKYLESDELDSEEKQGNSRRYPKRNFPIVSYKEVDVSSDDDYIYCGECDEQYDGSCPQHGPLIFIKDKKVPLGPKFAWTTCPDYLFVQSSSIEGAGLGIWTAKDLIKGLVFGPYKGNIVYTRKEAEDSGYAWEIRRSGKVLHYVDAADTSVSNWMRFINCARCEENQNLIAFQYHGEIYYRTYKPIKAFSELLVWYGNEFGDDLGIYPERSKNGESKNCDGDINRKHSSSVRTCNNLSQKFPCQTDEIHTNIAFGNRNASSLQVARKEPRFPKKVKFHVGISNGISLEIDTENKTARQEKDKIDFVAEGHVTAYGRNRNTDTEDTKLIVYNGTHLSSVNTYKNFLQKFPCQTNDTCTNKAVCSKNSSPLPIKRKKQRLSKKARYHDHKNNGISLEVDVKDKTAVEERDKVNFVVAETVTGSNRSKYRNIVDTKGIVRKPYSLRKNIRPVYNVKFLYKCQKCDYKATESDTVRKHMTTIHEEIKRLKNQKCNFESFKTRNLQHVDAVHERIKCYKCQKCNFESTKAKNLQRHIRSVHDKIRLHMCQKCSYRAFESYALRMHTNAVHEGLKPYKCNRCDHRTSQKSNLRKHIDVVHEKKKPYKCHKCYYRASIFGDLRSHIDAVHAKIKPHKCEKCDYKASKASTVRQHLIAVHDGKKPFKCRECTFRANFLSNLRAHVNAMHEKHKLYKCHKCCYKTYWSACLRKHTLSAHGKK